MKIGIYSPYLDTLAGGEKYILTIASCLSQFHDVELFWDVKEEGSLKTQIKTKFNIDLSSISFVENIFTTKTSFIARLQKSRKYDYILVLSDGSIPLVASKLILHFQTPMEWIHPSIKNSLKLLRVSAIVCNSFYTKKYIDKEFAVKSKVIYPPVLLQKKDEKKENIILNVGRFGVENVGSSAKKQEFMVESFKKIIDSGLKNWRLVLIISYKEENTSIQSFKESIKNYPIEIIENPTNDILWKFYNRAKIYWHAAGFGEELTKHPGRAEHFGISTVEAMGCGAVPIVINAGGQKEIITDAQNGFLWDTQEQFLKKTISIIEDAVLWEKLSSAASKRAEDFSKAIFCNAWNILIK